jgi:hypothetical protein
MFVVKIESMKINGSSFPGEVEPWKVLFGKFLALFWDLSSALMEEKKGWVG